MIYERQQRILNYLKQNKFATVKALSEVVYSSQSSVRRDLKALEQNGYIKQLYGSVVLSDYINTVVPVKLRESINVSIKDILAKEAAKQVFDGATLLLDGSSTVKRIMKYINHFKNLKVVTYNQQIFSEHTNPEIKLYCTGGRFDCQSNIFLGSTVENYISTINADLLFFSSQALSNDGIISDVSEEETALRKVMLSHAKKKIFLCDSSKLGLQKTFVLCDKNDVDLIICDKELPWKTTSPSDLL